MKDFSQQDQLDASREKEYQRYIASAQWKRLRQVKLKQAHGMCESCGVSKYQKRLEVHHLTYERFKHERLDDLVVLCPQCHYEADKRRKEKAERDRLDRLKSSRLTKGFIGWLKRRYPHDDPEYLPEYLIEMEYEAFLEWIDWVPDL